MECMWAPWRGKYVANAEKVVGCVFCQVLTIPQEQEREYLLLARGETTFVLMNRYPYNNGHLLFLPQQHGGALAELAPPVFRELHAWILKAQQALTALYHPEGFNLGMNLGRAAGAGIVDHLHYHLVPRWQGDVNFMPVLAETKVIPEHLLETYDRLRPYFV